MLREYYKFIRDYFKISESKKIYVFFMFITSFFSKALELFFPLLASLIIKYATTGEYKMTFIIVGILAISFLLYRIILLLNYKIYGYNMAYLYCNLHTKILNKLMTVDDNFTRKISKGKLLNSINSDVLDIGDTIDQIVEFFMIVLQIIALILIVSLYNLYFGLFFILNIIIFTYLRNYLDRKSNIYYNKQKMNMDQYSDLFAQVLNGLQEIKTFNMLPKIKEKLNNIKKQYSKNYLLKRKYYVYRQTDSYLVVRAFSLLLYTYLIYLISKGRFAVDILVLIIGYFETSIIYINNFITCTSTIREVDVGVKRVNSILNYKNSNEIIYGNNNNDYIEGIIEFKNVNFSYKENLILNNFSVKILPNKINAIVGSSGAGKTSIINLLLRLYKPNSGNIYIDEVDIYDYTKDIYFSNVSVVNQKPFIFNMSIRKNLDFIDNNIDNQIEACKRVGIHDFIVALPQGYNTILKEDANNISGGQKQLISLARTLLTKSEILLFDEITSSLDPDTASQISGLLEDLKKDHTIIMITHKPELMKTADRIIVIDKGKIVGDGKHKDLIDNNEIYQNLQSKKSGSRLGVFNND